MHWFSCRWHLVSQVVKVCSQTNVAPVICTSFYQQRLTLYLLLIGYLDSESDGGLEQDLAARRRYRALIPDDEYDSDE